MAVCCDLGIGIQESLLCPIYTPAIWKVCISQRVQLFMWQLSKNKLLTRDNLAKRSHVDDMSCLFCSKNESIHHLFFYCCVAANISSIVAYIL
jgi:hypothetical protein